MIYSNYYRIFNESRLIRRPGRSSKLVERWVALPSIEELPPIGGTDPIAVIKLVAAHEQDFERKTA